jgi:hypothetical protein
MTANAQPQDSFSVYEDTANGRIRHHLGIEGLHALAEPIPSHDSEGRPVDRAYWVAVNILRIFLGREWIARHVLPSGKTRSAFLRTNATDDRSFNEHLLRVIWLSEMIFNFQSKSGLEGPLDNLRAGQIETAFAELEVAKLLAIHDVHFRFITPEGERGGKNYDLEILHPNGELISGETKCKLEDTALTEGTITSTLKHARKQLPEGGAGIIFVKVPQNWMEAGDFRDKFSSIAKAVLSETSRVVAVVTYGSMLEFDETTREIKQGLIGREIRNHTLKDGRNWQILTLHDHRPANPNGWVSLPDLFPMASD